MTIVIPRLTIFVQLNIMIGYYDDIYILLSLLVYATNFMISTALLVVNKQTLFLFVIVKFDGYNCFRRFISTNSFQELRMIPSSFFSKKGITSNRIAAYYVDLEQAGRKG